MLSSSPLSSSSPFLAALGIGAKYCGSDAFNNETLSPAIALISAKALFNSSSERN
jgi:hypothetical protein